MKKLYILHKNIGGNFGANLLLFIIKIPIKKPAEAGFFSASINQIDDQRMIFSLAMKHDHHHQKKLVALSSIHADDCLN
ncbi:MAG: hypothetical protein RIQ74_1315 [Pseudomonadota bacterium]